MLPTYGMLLSWLICCDGKLSLVLVTSGSADGVPRAPSFPLSVRTGQKHKAYPQFCWEFHDQLLWVNEKATSEKESGLKLIDGGAILEMLWTSNLLCFPVLEDF